MGERLVCDTETDGLLADMRTLHMIQAGSLDGTDETIYADNLAWEEIERARNGVKLGDTLLRLTCPIRPLKEGLERIRAAETVYFHNGIGYDRHVFDKFAPGTLRREQVVELVFNSK